MKIDELTGLSQIPMLVEFLFFHGTMWRAKWLSRLPDGIHYVLDSVPTFWMNK